VINGGLALLIFVLFDYFMRVDVLRKFGRIWWWMVGSFVMSDVTNHRKVTCDYSLVIHAFSVMFGFSVTPFCFL
jgi:hypothetical protein